MTSATTVPVGTPALNEVEAKAAQARAVAMKRMQETQAAAGATPEAVKAAKAERYIQMPPDRMKGYEYMNNHHMVIVERLWTMDDVVKPIFWSSVWQRIRQWDEISVACEDGSWWAKLLVIQRGIGSVFVQVLDFRDFGENKTSAETSRIIEGFELRFLGALKKWCVIRTADAMTLKEKCESMSEAETWLTQYREQMARTALV